jgi:FkbM family methyltransferase
MSLKSRLAKVIAATPLYGPAQRFDERLWQFRGTLRGSYSQHGEDRFILDYFRGKPGTYVDVGANYPVKISNSYLLYRNGWTGLTVEPIPRLSKRHRKLRPRDAHANCAVGSVPGQLTFFEFDNSGLSTFDAARKDKLLSEGVKLIREHFIEIKPLSQLIDEKLAGRAIEFLSVDTEGFDRQVLESNDWSRHRPKLVTFESQDESDDDRIVPMLEQFGYRTLKNIGCNVILERRD